MILTATTLQPVKGSSITFACNADGRPAPNYRFSKKEFFTWKTVQSNNASTYFIPNIAPPSLFVYKKTFRCVPYNYLGEGASKSITIDVQGVLSFISLSFHFDLMKEVSPSAGADSQGALQSRTLIKFDIELTK